MNELETAAGLAPTPGYRYAEPAGDELHLAGQVPLDSAGTLLGAGDPAAQAEVCLGNLRLVVEAHGFTVGDVRRLTIYVVGEQPSLAAAWVSVRAWFGGEVPPATLLGVSTLGHPHQLVEVDAVVVRRR